MIERLLYLDYFPNGDAADPAWDISHDGTLIARVRRDQDYGFNLEVDDGTIVSLPANDVAYALMLARTWLSGYRQHRG